LCLWRFAGFGAEVVGAPGVWVGEFALEGGEEGGVEGNFCEGGEGCVLVGEKERMGGGLGKYLLARLAAIRH